MQAITESPMFKRLLEVVLTLGNFLNQGSFRGNAQGVKINFLGEMKSTKVRTSDRCGNVVLVLALAARY